VQGSLAASARGVLASAGSSVVFAGVFFVTPFLHPASAEGLWAVRCLITAPLLLLIIVLARQRGFIADIWYRLRARPLLIVPLLASAFLLTLQLWIFGWAPLHGRGLQVALGYFLLPLVLIVVGRLLYKDRLTWWQWLAAGIAAVGVVFELFRVGGISWETLVVCLGYPAYFVLRRSIRTGHLGGMFWDFALMLPFGIYFTAREIFATSALSENPSIAWTAPLYAVATGLALALYLTASKLLSLSLFGLLGYLEPALLMVASLLNGEHISIGEFVMYGAIWVAVLVIMVGGTVQIVRSTRRRSG